eukprot:1176893-Prorocentrum_minimum.AAC.2
MRASARQAMAGAGGAEMEMNASTDGDVDVKGCDVDEKDCDVDVKGCNVDVKGCDVDVKVCNLKRRVEGVLGERFGCFKNFKWRSRMFIWLCVCGGGGAAGRVASTRGTCARGPPPSCGTPPHYMDVKGCNVDVKGCNVDVKGCDVDVEP